MPCRQNKNPAVGGVIKVLRREGDSNPRYSYPYGSLANCWFKPLTHLSSSEIYSAFIKPPASSEASAKEDHPSLRNSVSGTKVKKQAKSTKFIDFYLSPLTSAVNALKFSTVSSSRFLSVIAPDFTELRNLLKRKFLGRYFSFIYAELAIVIPSLVSST